MPFRLLDELDDLEDIELPKPLPLRRSVAPRPAAGPRGLAAGIALLAIDGPSDATAIGTLSSSPPAGATPTPGAMRRPARLTRHGRSSRWRFGAGRCYEGCARYVARLTSWG